MAKSDALNDKQKAFVSYYLGQAKGNATDAAIMAGYSAKTAYSHGSRLLKDDEIQRLIKEAQDRLGEEGYRAKAARVALLDEVLTDLVRIKAERAAMYGGGRDDGLGGYTIGGGPMAGGGTGLMVKKITISGTGRNARPIEEHVHDKSWIDSVLNVSRQIAQEKGEWSEKRQISGPDDGPIEVKSAESASQKLLALLAQDEATEGPGEDPQETR